MEEMTKMVNITEISDNMAPAYKVTYFDITALGEPIRYLLSYGNLDFEDIRVSPETWTTSELKKNMPFGQMPILEHNGKVAHQSLAICRYLAKQVKLVGNNDWEDLEIDAIVDTVNDFRQKIGRYHYESDVKVKESLKDPLLTQTIPFYLDKLDAIAKQNGGYLAVGKLTWADLYFTALLDYLNNMAGKDLVADHANLAAVKANVLALPKIKSWVEKHAK